MATAPGSFVATCATWQHACGALRSLLQSTQKLLPAAGSSPACDAASSQPGTADGLAACQQLRRTIQSACKPPFESTLPHARHARQPVSRPSSPLSSTTSGTQAGTSQAAPRSERCNAPPARWLQPHAFPTCSPAASTRVLPSPGSLTPSPSSSAASAFSASASASGSAAGPTGSLFAARRQLSRQPEAAVYAGPSPRAPGRVTLRTIRKKYESGEPLTMVTAYDYPSAVHVDAADIDLLLVGDSVAMVVHGHDTTLPISLDEMISHCKAAARGARRAFLVGDLPFGCYETDPRDAVRSAVRVLKEGGMDAVKLEGGTPARVEAARAIVESGVAVMGHVGLTPQSVSVIGGFRPQAQVAEEALRVLDQAIALQRAGCFALVLECIPGPIAAAITRTLSIPTIGIGAGGECSGQVLVYHDLLGMMSHPHHTKVAPKFCKQYVRVGDLIGSALASYRKEVEERTFPGPRFSPYRIPDHEVNSLAEALRKRGLDGAAEAVVEEAQRAAAARKAEAEAAAAAAATERGAGGSGSGAA